MADDSTPLASIDPAVLAAVTGGASSGSSDQLTTMMQSLLSSIKDLSDSGNQSSGFDFMQMMPMMMNRGSSAPVEAAPAMPPDGDPSGWTKVA